MESQSNSENNGLDRGLDSTDDAHAEEERESFPGTEWADTGKRVRRMRLAPERSPSEPWRGTP
jgi:hypothetical protein